MSKKKDEPKEVHEFIIHLLGGVDIPLSIAGHTEYAEVIVEKWMYLYHSLDPVLERKDKPADEEKGGE